MEEETKIPLHDIHVKCMECSSKATAQEINNDVERYFSILKKNFVRFPEEGIKQSSLPQVEKMRLICEICYEKEYS